MHIRDSAQRNAAVTSRRLPRMARGHEERSRSSSPGSPGVARAGRFAAGMGPQRHSLGLEMARGDDSAYQHCFGIPRYASTTTQMGTAFAGFTLAASVPTTAVHDR